MATVFGHIYTKNNSGQIDKFVPILDSSEIRHDDGNVETVLNNSAKFVETEIESETETTTGPVIETYDGYGFYINDNNWNILYDSVSEYYGTPIESITTHTLYTSSTFLISSNITGIYISTESFNNEPMYTVMPNGTYNWIVSFTVSNSPYAEDSNNPGAGIISVSELPSIGQSKIFYPTVEYDPRSNTATEYTGTDIKFTITNVDGTNYTLSFIWEKTENADVTVKSLKTTVIKNDDTTAEVSNELSGLLQNGNITIEQKLVNAVFSLTSVPAYIEINDTNDTIN